MRFQRRVLFVRSLIVDVDDDGVLYSPGSIGIGANSCHRTRGPFHVIMRIALKLNLH